MFSILLLKASSTISPSFLNLIHVVACDLMAPVLDSFASNSIKNFLTLLKNVSGSMPSSPSILYLLQVPLNAPSNSLGPQASSAHRASLLVIRSSLFLLFFTLLIFLFNSAIFVSIHLDLFRGCSLSGALLIRSLGTLGSTNLRAFSDSLSLSFILSTSLFMDLIFFLLNPALVLSDALVTLSFKVSIWGFRLLISASRLTNFLVSLVSLFHLCFNCLLVRGASNSGCLTSFSCSHSSSQVDICGGQFGSQVDICGGGGGGPPRGALLH